MESNLHRPDEGRALRTSAQKGEGRTITQPGWSPAPARTGVDAPGPRGYVDVYWTFILKEVLLFLGGIKLAFLIE
jgi:hypothetical protein